MTIEIHQPELEALIQERMQTGAFESIEEVLLQALKTSPKPNAAETISPRKGLTGADLIATLQTIPYQDVDFEPERFPMPVRALDPL